MIINLNNYNHIMCVSSQDNNITYTIVNNSNNNI